MTFSDRFQPKPYTLHRTPQTLNPKRQTPKLGMHNVSFHLEPATL